MLLFSHFWGKKKSRKISPDTFSAAFEIGSRKHASLKRARGIFLRKKTKTNSITIKKCENKVCSFTLHAVSREENG